MSLEDGGPRAARAFLQHLLDLSANAVDGALEHGFLLCWRAGRSTGDHGEWIESGENTGVPEGEAGTDRVPGERRSSPEYPRDTALFGCKYRSGGDPVIGMREDVLDKSLQRGEGPAFILPLDPERAGIPLLGDRGDERQRAPGIGNGPVGIVRQRDRLSEPGDLFLQQPCGTRMQSRGKGENELELHDAALLLHRSS